MASQSVWESFKSQLRQSVARNGSKLFPTARCEDEEPELVDPQETLRAECKAQKCDKYRVKLETCNERVNSRSQTTESCYEELLDLFHCVDHCVAKNLFSKLK